MPEVEVPEIPEGLVIFTRLPSTMPYRVPELRVEYTNGEQVSGMVMPLSFVESRYRTTDDIKVLRAMADVLYNSFKVPGMYRFNKQIQRWTRSLT